MPASCRNKVIILLLHKISKWLIVTNAPKQLLLKSTVQSLVRKPLKADRSHNNIYRNCYEKHAKSARSTQKKWTSSN